MDIDKYNIGSSNYADLPVQPWMLWERNKLDAFDGDIIKRLMRDNGRNNEIEEMEKIIHVCRKCIDLYARGKKKDPTGLLDAIQVAEQNGLCNPVITPKFGFLKANIRLYGFIMMACEERIKELKGIKND